MESCYQLYFNEILFTIKIVHSKMYLKIFSAYCWTGLYSFMASSPPCHHNMGYYFLFQLIITVYPKKYADGFVVLCFVVVMQSFIMNSHEVFIHIHQGCFAGTGAIVRLPQCQWSKPDGYGKISQCITTTKHSKAKTVCIFLGIYCTLWQLMAWCQTVARHLLSQHCCSRVHKASETF